MKRFIIFSLFTSIATGLVTYFKATPENEITPEDYKTQSAAKIEDFITMKPSSTAHAETINSPLTTVDKKPPKMPVIHLDATILEDQETTMSSSKTEYMNAASHALTTSPTGIVATLSATKNSIPQTSEANTSNDNNQSKLPKNALSSGATSSVHKIHQNEQHSSMSALQDLAKGDPRAAYDLSLRYFRGDGVQQDSYRALQWMRNSAEKGDIAAQKAVGKLYMTGLEEMGADFREAEKWLTIAASRGDEEAEELLQKVSQGREKENQDYRLRKHLYSTSYRYWYYDSPYRLYWHAGNWRYH